MRTPRRFPWLEIAIAAVAPAIAFADDLQARIGRIESGLLAPVVIKGEGPRPMKLAERMAFYKTPAVSIALIDDGRIAWARAYGVLEAGKPAPATTETRFEAGSISKPVTAIAARRLVDAGKLDLDEDVDRKLVSWKVPENEFTRRRKVTLRQLLTHRAGVNVPSFIGYLAGTPVPTLTQVLDGKPPANTPAIRVDSLPGEQFRYSGGGYTIVQQLLVDVTGEPFPDLMDELVIKPLGMTHSTFHQPPFADGIAAMGHDAKGEMPAEKWRIFSEMAAAGLWTTPSDLARFAIDVHRSKRWDLGFFVEGGGASQRFEHGGSTREFTAHLMMLTRTGQGVVVMTNGARGDRLISELLRSIAREYGWDGFEPKEKAVAAIDPKLLAAYAGRYQFDFSADFSVTVGTRDGKLTTEIRQPTAPTALAELYPASETRFFRTDVDLEVEFVPNAAGRATHLIFHQEGQDFRATRLD
jgi:CubicO group peptidase (beta-lactamase class C family)